MSDMPGLDTRGLVIDHLSVGVADVDQARPLYDAMLGALGFVVTMDEPGVGIAYGVPDGWPVFWLQQPIDGRPPSGGSGTHIAFIAPSRAAVDAFHAAALAQGATCDGPPGPRDYHPTYYAAFVRDPFGNKLEAVCHLAP
jgi:catechol 2,3-dioxygenase-like lactoylglutathione lyase family enzyme